MAGATSTVENYIKKLYQEQQLLAESFVPMSRLTLSMGVAAGTATAMIKSLAKQGLVEYKPRVGSYLTERGNMMALQILRKHRLVESFLVEILHFDWSEVHGEAEILEHAISEKVADRMAEILGFPTVDPHGNPIPTEEGRLQFVDECLLSECRSGDIAHVQRIGNENEEFLKFVEKSGLVPGAFISIINRDDASGTVVVLMSESKTATTVGITAAAKIFVHVDVKRNPV
ncbi:MAG: metal-dependent transcriptional regulator [Spirochaetales bacterium]|jgi:DtxR family transcriptional regulator, Mn-dependent transcriptional regulator|nr:metal-dependent transcriptional regulator [Spirochaetales bacterium]